MAMTVLKTLGHLYDEVKGDADDFMDEEAFTSILNELVDNTLIDVGLISRTVISDDIILYHARPGLKWKDFCQESYITRLICLSLIQNPDVFFVLLNTQKGKMKIMLKFMTEWSRHKDKIVTFMIADNDKSIADQSVSAVEALDVEIFKLSSNSVVTFKSIKTYIDAYKGDTTNEYKPPVIILLNNHQQIEKKLKLQAHIRKMCISGLNLRYAELWDEADKTYTSSRDNIYMIDGVPTSCRTFTCDDTTGLHQLGFVTATEGDLLKDYPECANACLHVPEIDPEDIQNYRAFHHPESIIHPIPFSSHNNNSYATHVFETNREHFMTPITLPIGERYYRKIIVNSGSRTASMNELAKSFVREGMYVIVFNGYGGLSLKLYKDGGCKVYRTKGKVLRDLLYELYVTENLNDKPIVIIGNRKIDRGVGFHYCPRDGSNGLVWTDIILGKMPDTNTAVQKAGRGSGIIAQCPQYSGETHYWTDEATATSIKRHNAMVDKCSEQGYTAQQAVKRAEAQIPAAEPDVDPRKTVPIVINVTREDIGTLASLTNRRERKEYVLRLIHTNMPNLFEEVREYKFRKINECTSDNSYKKHITDVISHVSNNTPFAIDFSPEDKRGNCVNVFIDNRENRLVIVRWKGVL